jgi:hypothetical protein
LDDEDRPRKRRRGSEARKGVPLWVCAGVGVGGLLVLCGVVALVVFLGGTKKPATYTPMTADQLIDEWKSNPAAAAKKYERSGGGGAVDDVAIWKRALTAEEIATLWNGGAGTSVLTATPTVTAGTGIGANAPFAVGLQAYYVFDGNCLDSSGNGRDLTLVGNPTFAPGKFGQALVLDGTGNHYAVRPVSDSVFNFGSNDFTVQVWVNYSLSPAVRQQVLIEQFGPGGNGPGWTLTSDGSHFQFYPVEDGLDIGRFTTGIWHHVVAARRGGIFSFFYDGRYIPGTPMGGVITDSMSPLLIGRRNMGDPSNFALGGTVTPDALTKRPVSTPQERRFWPGGDNGGKERRWTRLNFRRMAIGKTQEWLLKELGAPDSIETNPRGGMGVGWIYRSVTYVPPSKTNDPWVMVYIDTHNNCDKVMYSDGSIYSGADWALPEPGL